MSRRIELPSAEHIDKAVEELSSADTGLTVSGLARHLGLANSTFWRHFPETAQSIADSRRQRTRSDPSPTRINAKGTDESESRLRAQVADLTAQVQAAAAVVQRLTLENHALRQQLEAEHSVIHIPRVR